MKLALAVLAAVLCLNSLASVDQPLVATPNADGAATRGVALALSALGAAVGGRSGAPYDMGFVTAVVGASVGGMAGMLLIFMI